MDTFSPSARARSEQKLYVPPHLRGILRGPVVPVVAPAPHKESHANVVPAVPPHLRGLEGNSSLKKEEWIPPHLRRACDSRCARVVEQKPVRRVFRYGMCKFVAVCDQFMLGSVPASGEFRGGYVR